MENLLREFRERHAQQATRRHFLRTCTSGLGAFALAGLTGCTINSNGDEQVIRGSALEALQRDYQAKAKRVIYLHMAGSPSQLELFDYKPELEKLDGQLCPESLLKGKTFAFINGVPKMLGPQGKFKQHGDSGAWVSEYMPHFATVADDVCFLKAMHTDQFNHAPAQLMVHCGSPRLGRPSIGSWVTYGLGSENENLPGFVVLVSGGFQPSAGKSIWGSGFLPTIYQGVQCRSEGDPVLYLNDPDGMTRATRRMTIDAINQLNEKTYQEVQDPEILTRIAQYEMAYKMQVSVPEVMDISREPAHIHKMYGSEPGASSFANNCLLARRMAEQGVRYIQLFHWGWDSHGAAKSEALNSGFIERCKETDRPIAALIKDLKQRGLFEETLVVWGGEFGRTPMMENRTGNDNPFIGRDHHTDAFTMWMAGGGIKGGLSYGETDEIGYYGIKDRVHLHDMQATMLERLGMDHEKFTYRFQGRDFRLTDVAGQVVKDILV